jgi:hypothetical protein
VGFAVGFDVDLGFAVGFTAGFAADLGFALVASGSGLCGVAGWVWVGCEVAGWVVGLQGGFGWAAGWVAGWVWVGCGVGCRVVGWVWVTGWQWGLFLVDCCGFRCGYFLLICFTLLQTHNVEYFLEHFPRVQTNTRKTNVFL